MSNKLITVIILFTAVACSEPNSNNEIEANRIVEASEIIMHQVKVKSYASKGDEGARRLKIDSKLTGIMNIYESYVKGCNSCGRNQKNIQVCLKVQYQKLLDNIDAKYSKYDIGTDLLSIDELKLYQYPLESSKLKGAMICHRLSQEVW